METRETITLDAKAQQRLLVLTHVLAGELAIADAAAYLRLSARQVGRLADRLRTEGAAGLATARGPLREPRPSEAAGISSPLRYRRRTPASTPSTSPRAWPKTIPRRPRRGRSGGSSARRGSRPHGPGVHPSTGAGASGCPGRECSSRPTGAGTTWPRGGALPHPDRRHRRRDGGRHGRDLPPPTRTRPATSSCSARRSPGTVSRLPCTRTFTPSSSRIPTAARRSPSSSLASPPAPRSDALSRRPASAGSGPAARRPRAVRSACGARSRTASCPSSGARAWRPSRTPTRSWPDTCPATTGASRFPPPIPSRPGGHGPTARHRRRSSASSTPAGWSATPRSAGTVGP